MSLGMGTWIKGIIEKRLNESERTDIAVEAIETMNRIMIENTDMGKSGATGGEYVNTYSERYAKAEGRPLSPVTLQSTRGNRSKRTAGAIPLRAGAQVGFAQNSEILELHSKGEAKGGKKRQMFPESVQQFPDEVLLGINNAIKKRMR